MSWESNYAENAKLAAQAALYYASKGNDSKAKFWLDAVDVYETLRKESMLKRTQKLEGEQPGGKD